MSFTRSWMGFLIDTHSKIERGSENCWGWSVDSDPFWHPNLWPERTLGTSSLSLFLCWLSVGFSQWKTEARAWTVGGEIIWICFVCFLQLLCQVSCCIFPQLPFQLEPPHNPPPSQPPAKHTHSSHWELVIYDLPLVPPI